MRVTSYTIPIELLERARIQSVQELGTAAGFVEVAEVPVVVVLELVVPVLVVLVLVVLDEAFTPGEHVLRLPHPAPPAFLFLYQINSCF